MDYKALNNALVDFDCGENAFKSANSEFGQENITSGALAPNMEKKAPLLLVLPDAHVVNV